MKYINRTDNDFYQENGVSMRNLRIFACIFALFAGTFAVCSADLEISGAVISGGGFMRVFRPDSTAYCELTLKNQTGKKQEFIVCVQSAKEKSNPDACFSKSFTVPPKTVCRRKMTVRLDGSPLYYISAEIFPEALKTAELETQALYVKNIDPKTGEQEKLYLIVRDRPSELGAFVRQSAFFGKVYAFPMSSAEMPPDLPVLEHFNAVMIHGADYAKWDAARFDALRQYVQKGGTLLFASPEDAEKAQATPLAELLPAEIPANAVTVQTTLNDVLKSLGKTDRMQFPVRLYPLILRSDAKVIHSWNNHPVFAEKRTGQGMCRITAVPLAAKNLVYLGKCWDKTFTMLLESKTIPPRPLVYTKSSSVSRDASADYSFAMKLQSKILEITQSKEVVLALMLVSVCGSLLIAAAGFFLKTKLWRGILWLILYNALAVALLLIQDGAVYRLIPVDWLMKLI